MPSTSQENLDLITSWFKGENNWIPPLRFLSSRGYLITKDYSITHSCIHYQNSPEEIECITYLQDEWDFGPYLRLNLYPEVQELFLEIKAHMRLFNQNILPWLPPEDLLKEVYKYFLRNFPFYLKKDLDLVYSFILAHISQDKDFLSDILS